MKAWKRYRKHQYPVCAELRRVRKERGERLDVMAEMIGYHWTTVSRWERGECFPSLQALHDWCQVLNVSLQIRTHTERLP